MLERLGGGRFKYPFQITARGACFLFLIIFLNVSRHLCDRLCLSKENNTTINNDWDHISDFHSSSTINSNRECPSSLYRVCRQARGNGIFLEMRWTGGMITIYQSVVVEETRLRIHRYPIGLKVMYDLKQQRNCWSLPAIWRELLRFWRITPDYSSTLALLGMK